MHGNQILKGVFGTSFKKKTYIFKQHYTYFYTLFNPHVFLHHIFKQ